MKEHCSLPKIIIDIFSCRKKLKKGILLYIHINLASSLLLAMIVFLLGVDRASFNKVKQISSRKEELFPIYLSYV